MRYSSRSFVEIFRQGHTHNEENTSVAPTAATTTATKTAVAAAAAARLTCDDQWSRLSMRGACSLFAAAAYTRTIHMHELVFLRCVDIGIRVRLLVKPAAAAVVTAAVVGTGEFYKQKFRLHTK